MSGQVFPSNEAKLEEKAQVEDIVVDALTSKPSEVAVASRAEERWLVRKLDRRIMPMLATMYLFATLDRTNLGNARLQGLPQDILHGDPTGMLFDWANSAFFFSYVTCQVPLLLISKLYSTRKWIGCAAICWGLSSTLIASAFNFPGLIVARLALGVFEAGFAPSLPLYLCEYSHPTGILDPGARTISSSHPRCPALFYTRGEIGLRIAGWYMCSSIAGAFGGLIAFGVQHAHTVLANWRLLFLVEGIPTILLGMLALVVLPDRPAEETALFTEREREIAVERMNRGGKADVGRVVQRKHISMAFRDWKLYAAGTMFFAANCALTSIQAFLPTIIASFGFSDAAAQILTVPPYAAAVIVLCLSTYLSDRLQHRGPLLIVVPSNNHVRYFATFCISTATAMNNAMVLTWFSHNLGSGTKKAAGMPLFMSIGHCGSILGSHLFPMTEAPRYVKGFAVTCGFQFLMAVIAGVLMSNDAPQMYYKAENRRRDELYGKPIPGAPVDLSELADKAHDFRYTP
ncbi:MFS general substrate transporter [Ganoderma sinense ZZ0214-1]|uniref:MFS general substrate transporter n=1 Tax=Ganoderma sinense ZZ0214-1 TaxID=1077348 RepID=A0A2G8RPG9_9APHY|nr:MFS general substrate transporter [Ganoderma sinense ZZ0214-1]